MMRISITRLLCYLSLSFLLISCGGSNPLFTQGSAISESKSGTEVSEAPTSQSVDSPSESLPSSQSVSQGGTGSDQLLPPPNEVSSIDGNSPNKTTTVVKTDSNEATETVLEEVKDKDETVEEDDFTDETDDLNEEEISKDFEIIPAKDCCAEQPAAFIQIYLIKNKKRAELRTIRRSCKKLPDWVTRQQRKKKQPFYYFGSCYAKRQPLKKEPPKKEPPKKDPRKKDSKDAGESIDKPGSYRGQSRRR